MKTIKNLFVYGYDANGVRTSYKVTDENGVLYLNRLRRCFNESVRVEVPFELFADILRSYKRNSEGLKRRNCALDYYSQLLEEIQRIVESGESENDRLVAYAIDMAKQRRKRTAQGVELYGR